LGLLCVGAARSRYRLPERHRARAGGRATEQQLIDKLRHIAALYAGATTAGERAAALKAHERVAARLDRERRVLGTEYRFTMADGF